VFSTNFDDDDHGGPRGDTVQALAQLRHPVASSVAPGCAPSSDAHSIVLLHHRGHGND
jgi:hypothetical protein